MARIIIGACLGYFVMVLSVAISSNYAWEVRGTFIFTNFGVVDDVLMLETLVPVLVGAVMGWAWNRIALEKHTAAGRTQINDKVHSEQQEYEQQRQGPQYNWKK